MWQGLVDHGVLVRDCSGWPRLDGCLRVTIGTPDENDRFLAALAAVLGHEPHGARAARATKETSIELTIDLDGSGVTRCSTGIPFYDHMLDQLGRHGGFDLTVQATGDLHIDTHHTVEDVAITLGEAFREALGDKAGVRRFASGLFPLDEALVEVALDLSGRPFVVWDVACRRAAARHPALRPAARRARGVVVRHHRRHHAARHVAAGRNVHHIIEATFKGLARCLRDAVRVESPAACPPPRACCEPGADVDPLIAVVDYGIGNLRSAQKALQRLGADARLTADPGLIADAEAVVLPGVGRLRGLHGRAARAASWSSPCSTPSASGRPFLGICVGMQMLFDGSEEDPGAAGLGVIPGMVRWLPDGVKRPQMQWNRFDIARRRSDVRRPGRAAVVLLRALAARRARRPDDGRRDVRVRRPGQRRVPRAATCSRPSSTPRSRRPAGSGCSATSSARAVRALRLYPSIDLRGGKVVRLQQGDYDARRPTATTRLPWRRRSRRGCGVGPRRRPRRGAHRRAGQPLGRRRHRAAVGGRAAVQTGGGVRTVDDAGRSPMPAWLAS